MFPLSEKGVFLPPGYEDPDGSPILGLLRFDSLLAVDHLHLQAAFLHRKVVMVQAEELEELEEIDGARAVDVRFLNVLNNASLIFHRDRPPADPLQHIKNLFGLQTFAGFIEFDEDRVQVPDRDIREAGLLDPVNAVFDAEIEHPAEELLDGVERLPI